MPDHYSVSLHLRIEIAIRRALWFQSTTKFTEA
jgi:hypothetical protein